MPVDTRPTYTNRRPTRRVQAIEWLHRHERDGVTHARYVLERLRLCDKLEALAAQMREVVAQ
jgi:hypothetical protein